jgi:hypothetical protein
MQLRFGAVCFCFLGVAKTIFHFFSGWFVCEQKKMKVYFVWWSGWEFFYKFTFWVGFEKSSKQSEKVWSKTVILKVARSVVGFLLTNRA